MDKPANESVLLCGRYFTLQELLEIQATVRMFPKLSRAELVSTLCENLDWITPTGKYKRSSCLDLLDKLEAQGLIIIPDKREIKAGARKGLSFGPLTAPAALLEGSLSNHEPVVVEPVYGKDSEFHLWNEYVHRYHSVGYKHTFGASQCYFIISGSGQKLERSVSTPGSILLTLSCFSPRCYQWPGQGELPDQQYQKKTPASQPPWKI